MQKHQAKMQGLDWNDLRFALAVGRGRSLAEAGRQLRVDETTVGRHISRIENHLGTRLFERVRGSYLTTEAGRALIAGAERVEALVQGLESKACGADKRAAGVVRLTAVPMLVNRVLVPALPGLLHEHPHLKVELIAQPRDLSLTRRETDLALRLARPNKELSAVARRIDRLDYAVYEAHGPAARRRPWITYEDSMADLPQCRWMQRRLKDEGETVSALKVNDAEAIIAAIKAGIGVSLLPVALGDKEPGIRRRAADQTAFGRELWLLTHPDMRDLARIKVVSEWLIASVRRFTGNTDT